LLILNTGDNSDGTTPVSAGFNRAAFGSTLITLFNRCAQVENDLQLASENENKNFKAY